MTDQPGGGALSKTIFIFLNKFIFRRLSLNFLIVFTITHMKTELINSFILHFSSKPELQFHHNIAKICLRANDVLVVLMYVLHQQMHVHATHLVLFHLSICQTDTHQKQTLKLKFLYFERCNVGL